MSKIYKNLILILAILAILILGILVFTSKEAHADSQYTYIGNGIYRYEGYRTNYSDNENNYYNNYNSNYNNNNNSGPIWYDNGLKQNLNTSTINNKTITNTTTKTNTTNKVATATKSKTATTSNDSKNTSNAQKLTAGALWGANDSFMPSGFFQWLVFFILLMLAIILWRKLYLNSRERNAPLKHA